MPVEAWTRYQLRWGLGQLLALIALAAVLQLGVTGTPLILACAGLIVLATARPGWTGRVQPYLVRFAPKVLLVVVFLDFITSAGDVIPPLARTFSLLLTYRALEFREPRQDRQLILLGLLLLLLTGTLSANLLFALKLFLFVPVALLLLAVTVAEERTLPAHPGWKEPWEGFSWWRWFRRMRRRTDRRILAFAGVLYAAFGVATMLLFWSLPRFEFGHQLPFLKLPAQQSFTGFSESVSFGSVTQIQQDFSVAMRVDAPEEASGLQPYWRMMVLDEYVERGFQQSESAREAFRTEVGSRFPGGASRRGWDREEVWTHFFEGGVSRQVPLPGAFHELRFTSRQELRFNSAVHTIALREASANMLVFQLHGVEPSPLLPPVPADLVLREANGPRWVGPGEAVPDYPWSTLALPAEAELRSFLEAAVAEITAPLGPEFSLEAFAARAIVWLQQGRGYSLESSVGDSERPLLAWMKRKEPGHCELYAGSFLLLARQAGFPARLVTGFHGGIWNGFEDYLMVRHADAHAWVEVYQPGAGWWRFDPTPGNTRVLQRAEGPTLARMERPRPIDATFAAYIDSLRVLWYRKVVDFDHADQQAMVEAAQTTVADWLAVLQERIGRIWEALQEILQSPWSWRAYLDLIPPVGVLVLLALLARLVLKRWQGSGRVASPERRVRRRAEYWLQRGVQAGHPAEAERAADLRRRLEMIRFGDPRSWDEPAPLFREARQRFRR